MNRTALIGCLERFAGDVVRVVGDLRAHFGVDTLLAGRRSRVIPRTGEAAGWRFEFHGAGLRAWRRGTWVDFDFVSGDRAGFDPWRIHWYLENNGIDEVDAVVLEALFRELETDGIIRSVGDRGLFVLSGR